MSTREEAEFQVADMAARSEAVRADVKKAGGPQRLVDVFELFTARAAMQGINLSRYRKHPELAEAIRRARRALAEVWEEMRVLR